MMELPSFAPIMSGPDHKVLMISGAIAPSGLIRGLEVRIAVPPWHMLAGPSIPQV
jgi:hypothetical protein